MAYKDIAETLDLFLTKYADLATAIKAAQVYAYKAKVKPSPERHAFWLQVEAGLKRLKIQEKLEFYRTKG